MAMKLMQPAKVAESLDETSRFEEWADQKKGPSYFDVHVSVIEKFEAIEPILRERLETPNKIILESGCGSGRWVAYFEQLGHVCIGLDDSTFPLSVAREHAPSMRLVRGDVRTTPFQPSSFDAVFSSYVAEHFEEGPTGLFKEIHRVLKPNGQFLLIVPFYNMFRRLVVNPILKLMYVRWRVLGGTLAFAEFRYTRREVEGFLNEAGFTVARVLPDDFRLPWSKGLFVDLCDVGAFVEYYPPAPLFQFGRVGRFIARSLNKLGAWCCCGGMLVIAQPDK